MAVSNAIGSNVFDINFGLGIPFIVRIIIDFGKPIAILDNQEQASTALVIYKRCILAKTLLFLDSIIC